MVLGTGRGAGADEDDFHILNRSGGDVGQEERRRADGEKKKKAVGVKAGAHSGVVREVGVGTKTPNTNLKRTVVYF